MRKVRTVLAGLGAAAIGALALSAPASAHVTIDPEQAKRGGYARVVFRLPNESETASTVKLEVHLPESQPLSSVRTSPIPGWVIEVTKTKLATPIESYGSKITQAITKITWTAASPDAQVKPGQFMDFPVSLGKLPDADQMVFKALQTYSDGNIVRWIEEKTGAEEPENPAPVLGLVADVASVATATTKGETWQNEAALPLAVTGALAGLLGFGVGAAAFVRKRSSV
jgi:uncharacterized protein YcnI